MNISFKTRVFGLKQDFAYETDMQNSQRFHFIFPCFFMKKVHYESPEIKIVISQSTETRETLSDSFLATDTSPPATSAVASVGDE